MIKIAKFVNFGMGDCDYCNDSNAITTCHEGINHMLRICHNCAKSKYESIREHHKSMNEALK